MLNPQLYKVVRNKAISLEPDTAFETMVYPNPFTESFSIQTSKEDYSHLRLLDISGKVLVSKKLNKERKVCFNPSYSEVPAGMYFIQLISAEEVKTIKVMRE